LPERYNFVGVRLTSSMVGKEMDSHLGRMPESDSRLGRAPLPRSISGEGRPPRPSTPPPTGVLCRQQPTPPGDAPPPRGPHRLNFTEPLGNAEDDRSPTRTPLAAPCKYLWKKKLDLSGLLNLPVFSSLFLLLCGAKLENFRFWTAELSILCIVFLSK
jgi:hypothetical protein